MTQQHVLCQFRICLNFNSFFKGPVSFYVCKNFVFAYIPYYAHAAFKIVPGEPRRFWSCKPYLNLTYILSKELTLSKFHSCYH